MSRMTLREQYEREGLSDYKLRNIEDLKKLHGIKFERIEGYNKLCQKDKEMFNRFIINYYNSHEVKERWIIPIRLFKALEEDYIIDDFGKEVLVRRVTYMLCGGNERRMFNIWCKKNSENMFSRLGRVSSCIIVNLIENGKVRWVRIKENSLINRE